MEENIKETGEVADGMGLEGEWRMVVYACAYHSRYISLSHTRTHTLHFSLTIDLATQMGQSEW